MKTTSTHTRSTHKAKLLKSLSTLALAMTAVFGVAAPASAVPILGADLASFSVLGHLGVTNVPTSTIGGNVGSAPSPAITGFNSSPGVAVSDPQVGGLVHANTALAISAQAQLTTARLNLDSMGTGTTLVLPDLTGLTLAPGVYTVHSGVTNLSGVLTLDGAGNANAAWVFQMDSDGEMPAEQMHSRRARLQSTISGTTSQFLQRVKRCGGR